MIQATDPMSASGPRRPRFRALTEAQCRSLLGRSLVGRLAFGFHGRVDVEPIHYAMDEDWVYGRTSPGVKTAVLRHNPWVALEVDEVAGLFDWRSVVVHGTLYFLTPDGTPSMVERWGRALAALRRIVPTTGTAEDPVPFRDTIFGIHINSWSGRAASSGAARRP